jgi:hypothetical protein
MGWANCIPQLEIRVTIPSMKMLPIAVLCLACGCTTHASLVGMRVPPYPAGMTERSGTCLPAAGGAKDCQYSLSVIDSDSTAPSLAVALESTTGGTREQPLWRVVDTAELPRVRSGYSLEMGSCRVDERKDEGVMAIVKTGTEKYWGDSYWAVRFDRKQKRFVTLPAAAVDCAGADPNCL